MSTMSTQQSTCICCLDDLSYGLNTLGPLCLWQCFSKFVVRRMHRHLHDDIKIREQVEPTLLTSSALFDLKINLDYYFYKTREVIFLIFVSPYFWSSELYFILPPEFLQFCFDHHLVRLAYMTLITNCKGLL